MISPTTFIFKFLKNKKDFTLLMFDAFNMHTFYILPVFL